MRRAGLTLIELVVALTLASTILAAAYAGLTTALDRRERAVALLEADAEALDVRSMLREWLMGARIEATDTVPLLNGGDGVFGGESDDRLSFLSSAPTPFGPPAIVTLFIDRDPETQETGLVAEIAEWEGTDRLRIPLVPEATGLEVRYYSSLQGRAWHPSWISSSVMPAGVEITLIGGEDLHALLRAPLRVALEGGS